MSQHTDAAKFYKECIEKQKPNCSCTPTIESLKLQISEMRDKCSNAEKAIGLCHKILEKKDRQITELSKKITPVIDKTNTSASPEEKTECTPEPIPLMASIKSPDTTEMASTRSVSNKPFMYSKFSKYFDEEGLCDLRSIGLKAKDDSSFIRKAVQQLYKKNIDCLKTKSLSGRGKGKCMMTPEKVDVLTNLYTERMSNVSNDPDEQQIRAKKLSTLIKDAINNTNRLAALKIQEEKTVENLVLSLK